MPIGTHIAEADPDPDALTLVPEGACINWDICENVAAGANVMCGGCLDTLRERDRRAEYRSYLDYLTELHGRGDSA